jgi:hypothetical protein
MRSFSIALISIVLGLAAFSTFVGRHRPSGVSNWSISSSQLELQARVGGEEVRGEVVLANLGSVPISFNIERTCSCTAVEPGSGTVSPGTSLPIQISIRAPSLAGSTSSAHIRFVPESQSKTQPLTCQVTAEYPSAFESSPRIVDFGNLGLSDVATATHQMTIRASSAAAEELDFDRLTPRSTSSKFQISVLERTSQDITIEVALAGDLEIGRFFGAVEFGDPRGGGGISVPVRAHIAGALTVVPSLVRFVESGDGFQPATITVLNRPRDNKSADGDLRIVEDDCGLALEPLGTGAGGRQKYRLVVIEPQAFREKQPTEVHLAVGDAGESCRIRLLVASPSGNANLGELPPQRSI